MVIQWLYTFNLHGYFYGLTLPCTVRIMYVLCVFACICVVFARSVLWMHRAVFICIIHLSLVGISLFFHDSSDIIKNNTVVYYKMEWPASEGCRLCSQNSRNQILSLLLIFALSWARQLFCTHPNLNLWTAIVSLCCKSSYICIFCVIHIGFSSHHWLIQILVLGLTLEKIAKMKFFNSISGY